MKLSQWDLTDYFQALIYYWDNATLTDILFHCRKLLWEWFMNDAFIILQFCNINNKTRSLMLWIDFQNISKEMISELGHDIIWKGD